MVDPGLALGGLGLMAVVIGGMLLYAKFLEGCLFLVGSGISSGNWMYTILGAIILIAPNYYLWRIYHQSSLGHE